MARHPEIQAKAQREIDMVIGQDRLPDFADQSRLVYTRAIMLECLRWNPVLPLGECHLSACYLSKWLTVSTCAGLAHTSTEDDVYKGFFIPKGSMVFANVWFACPSFQVCSR
jgi:hypothetical protein